MVNIRVLKTFKHTLGTKEGLRLVRDSDRGRQGDTVNGGEETGRTGHLQGRENLKKLYEREHRGKNSTLYLTLPPAG